MASTKLNICAVLSTLNRHTEARKHAEEAVANLMETLAESRFEEKQSTQPELTTKDLLKTVTVAFFNLAVEHEHLLEFKKSILAY